MLEPKNNELAKIVNNIFINGISLLKNENTKTLFAIVNQFTGD